MRRLQRGAQIAALASLVVFVVLIAVTATELVDLKKEVAAVEKDLAAKDRELDAKSRQLEELDGQLEERQRKLDVVNQYYTEMARRDPGLARSATAAVLEADPQAAEVLPRVYIHIRNERQRAQAAEVTRALEAAGFVVPGVERLVDVGPDTSELRYFRRSEAAVADAARAAEVLRGVGLELQPKFVPGYEESKAIRARHYELWLARDAARHPL